MTWIAAVVAVIYCAPVTALCQTSVESSAVLSIGKGKSAYDRGDYVTAYGIWKPLAETGDAQAQNNLGVMYTNGQGVARNYAVAATLYRMAAEKGNPRAQYNLGIIYRDGQGVPQDYSTAVLWFRKAAEQGHAAAQTNLGAMYENGFGVARDNNVATIWYRLAAKQGYSQAQVRLVDLCKANPAANDCLGPTSKDAQGAGRVTSPPIPVPAEPVHAISVKPPTERASVRPPPLKLAQKALVKPSAEKVAVQPTVAPVEPLTLNGQICAGYGFSPGTTPFSQCLMDLDSAQKQAEAQQLQFELEERRSQEQYALQQQQYQSQLTAFQAQQTAIAEERKRQAWLGVMRFGLGMAASSSPYFSGGVADGLAAFSGMPIAKPEPPARPTQFRSRVLEDERITIRTPNGTSICHYQAAWRRMTCN